MRRLGDKNKMNVADVLNRWRDPANPWRKEPFFVEKLPTVFKVRGDGVCAPMDCILGDADTVCIGVGEVGGGGCVCRRKVEEVRARGQCDLMTILAVVTFSKSNFLKIVEPVSFTSIESMSLLDL